MRHTFSSSCWEECHCYSYCPRNVDVNKEFDLQASGNRHMIVKDPATVRTPWQSLQRGRSRVKAAYVTRHQQSSIGDARILAEKRLIGKLKYQLLLW